MQAEWPVRVYYEDTDAGGVVYHAGYLRFLERARTEWLRTLGYSQVRLKQEESLVFTVVGMTLDFLKPARLDDLLRVRSQVRLAGGAKPSASSPLPCAWPASMPTHTVHGGYRPRFAGALNERRTPFNPETGR
jgi:YbgC/YbaW family acyl-CoA thioester hydrolase